MFHFSILVVAIIISILLLVPPCHSQSTLGDSCDPSIQDGEQCREREDSILWQHTMETDMQDLVAKFQQLQADMARLSAENGKLKRDITMVENHRLELSSLVTSLAERRMYT